MKSKICLVLVCIVCLLSGQRKEFERPVQHAARGMHGAVACGSEFSAEAGMRMFFQGGNAVDAAIASMFAAMTSEFSHIGWGGEAPILIRSKDGKVHAIAGVGPMPKLATADFYRTRRLQAGGGFCLHTRGGCGGKFIAGEVWRRGAQSGAAGVFGALGCVGVN